MASTPRWTQRAALGLESVSCDAPLWLCQSSLWQCQRGALCQPREVWLQRGLARVQTAMEARDGSRLPQSMGKILYRNKPQLREDWRWESHNEPSKQLQLAGKKESQKAGYNTELSQGRVNVFLEFISGCASALHLLVNVYCNFSWCCTVQAVLVSSLPCYTCNYSERCNPRAKYVKTTCPPVTWI